MTTETKHPWDEEPTPLCDERVLLYGSDSFMSTALEFERRLRHAWKLVNSLRIDAMNGELDCELTKQRLADIEEALCRKKESNEE